MPRTENGFVLSFDELCTLVNGMSDACNGSSGYDPDWQTGGRKRMLLDELTAELTRLVNRQKAQGGP